MSLLPRATLHSDSEQLQTVSQNKKSSQSSLKMMKFHVKNVLKNSPFQYYSICAANNFAKDKMLSRRMKFLAK
jgi:hypothetical protein